MNTELFGAFTRHAITVLAGAILANNNPDINIAIQTLYQNLATGDTAALVGAGGVIFAILWSMWIKFTEETKQIVIKKLSFKK